MTFVQATFILAIFVHIRNIKPDFDQSLKVGSWEHLEQVPIVRVPFVRATFLYFRNIADVTEQILTRLKAKSRHDQRKVKAKSRQGQGNDKARSKQGQGKAKEISSRQSQC